MDPDDVVVYANSALADYLGVPKGELPGTPLEVLAQRATGEVAGCFLRPESGRTTNRLVTDEQGRVFEAKTYSEGGVLDILLDEVTPGSAIGHELLSTSGTPLDSLSEEELRTARMPERRYLTVSVGRLRDGDGLADRLPPVEARLMVDCFHEEAGDAILESGCTVASGNSDGVLGIFGAPRLFADHPLRAVRAACETARKLNALHAGFHRQGKELPPFACGLWTGDTLVGSLGGSFGRRYGALGQPVDLADRLSRLARGGEILLPEHTLTHLLRVLPEGWTHLRAESEAEPDLSSFEWSGEDVVPLPEELRRIVFLIGPGVDEDAAQAEYYFDYLWALQVPGHERPVPILRVVRPTGVGDSIELRDDNVIATQSSVTLGKYRLLEVIGSGGMGRVWKGVDRFGNPVAIKVLHSHENIGESQLKRFRREAEIMGRLPHRNICRVYEMNEFEGVQYIAMEFVDGLSLAEVLYGGAESSNQRGPLDLGTIIRSLRASRNSQETTEVEEGEQAQPPRPARTLVLPVQQTLALVLRVCEAIQFAHEHGVLHRDLKPGNILLREDGEPLVADFGLAKLVTPDATHSLSISGHVVGTFENMPPEQAESSKDVDERADVYAIGTILYQMLTGKRHFEATGNIVTDAQNLRTHEPVRLRSVNPRIDPDLEIITLKALRNDPNQRYRSVSALRADLERYVRGEVIAAKPVSAVDLMRKLVRRNRTATAVAAGSFALIVLTVVAAVWSLSAQLAREQAARQEAEELRLAAEASEKLAEDRQKVAEAKEKEATALVAEIEKKRRELADALEKKQAAELAAQGALESSAVARAETAAERERRLQIEEAARKEAEALKQHIEALQAGSRQPTTPLPYDGRPFGRMDRDPSKIAAARRSLTEAVNTLNFELSPSELGRMEKQPERVLDRLSRALDQAAFALLEEPEFAPGWMLKGRLHLAALEFPAAAKAFRQAAQMAASLPDGVPGTEDAAKLEAYAESTKPSLGLRAKDMAAPLYESASALDHATANIMVFLASQRSLTSLPGTTSPTGSPFGRVPGNSEIALTLMTANKTPDRPVVHGGPPPAPLSVEIHGTARDLSVLRGLPVGSLSATSCAELDWETIQSLPLTRLDLSGSTFDSLPNNPRSLTRLVELDLSGTSVESIESVRWITRLESLDIADSSVKSVAPLSACRRLRRLDLGAINPAGLAALAMVPLEFLTLDPDLIDDAAGLVALRAHRTLKQIRKPGDDSFLPAAVFWRANPPR
ncbi:MAG: hypothetical protein Fur0032_13430 [Terrimicrobiaceae bacterium]